MQKFLDDVNNRRAFSGNLPIENLYPAPASYCGPLEIGDECIRSIKGFGANPRFIIGFFIKYIRLLIKKYLDSGVSNSLFWENQLQSNIEDFFIYNIIVNTNHHPETLSINSCYHAYTLHPTITQFDHILYNCFVSAFSEYQHLVEYKTEGKEIYEDEITSWKSLSFYFVHLLQIVQEKELESGLTINSRRISILTPINHIILSGWKKPSYYLRRLTKDEQEQLQELYNHRKALVDHIKNEGLAAEQVAAKTDDDWIDFLDYLNDLASRESETISIIVNSDNPKSKLTAIEEYERILHGIASGHYDLNGKQLDTNKLFSSVEERIRDAFQYTNVISASWHYFRMHPVLLHLATEPTTFNSFFIKSHHFRLSSNLNTATEFARTALFSIRKNLETDENPISDDLSLHELIKLFFVTVSNFYEKNREVIKQLSFKSIQDDSIIIGDAYPLYIWSEFWKETSDRVRSSITSSLDFKKVVLICSAFRRRRNKTLDSLFCVSSNEDIKSKILANQFVISINIIYLFCNALLKIKNNPNEYQIDPVEIDNIYEKLLKIQGDVSDAIYSDIGSSGIQIFRIKKGIDAGALSDRERDSERLCNEELIGSMIDAIRVLTSDLDSLTPEALFERQKEIRSKINDAPECELKDHCADRLEEEINKVLEKLVQNAKQCDGFENARISVLEKIGPHSNILPDMVIQTLSTAEYLFNQHATAEYAEQGFDYSSISALYYQSFETAYNKLIWSKYAEWLNSEMFDGRKFKSILRKWNKDPSCIAREYLPDNSIHYIKNNLVLDTLAYDSFSKVMKSIHDPSNLPGFCDRFAKLAGFVGKNEMYKNAAFMKMCSNFAEAIHKATDNRNTASHGGTVISYEQCTDDRKAILTDDKKAVIRDLREKRNCTIGLMQQLVELMKNAPVEMAP